MVLRHNLPILPTPFVGRTSELTEIIDRLNNDQCRLLTLVGAGGAGKTRLAIEVATRLINQETPPAFSNVYFVPLQSLASPDLIPSALAEAFDLQFYAGEEPLRQLIDFLNPTTALLILDNLEHLLAGVGLLPAILSGAPNIKILTTSRETLNLQEEWLYPVNGMAFPDGGRDPQSYDAVQLFIQLARRVRPDFSLEAEQSSILRICQLVEGMPLALEMTAAWLKRLPADQIVREIERGLDILENPARNVPPRHRSMRSVFEHSWDLLKDAERDALKKLSIFRGGFDRQAAIAVAEAPLGILSTLVDKSWLRVNALGRYDFHELARQYAEEQLCTSPEINQRAHDLHCDYFIDFLAQRYDGIMRLRAKGTMDEVATELDNVRAAWEWAIDHRDSHDVMKIGWPFGHYLNDRWLVAEGVEVFGEAIARFQNREGRSLELAVAKYYKALCANKLGRYGEARSLTEAVVAGTALLEEHPWLITSALINLCDISTNTGDYDHAQQFGRQSVERLRQEGRQDWFLALALLYLARALNLCGEYSEARELLLEAIALAMGESGSPRWIAETRSELGYLELSLGAYQEARFIFAENLAFARSFEHRKATVTSLIGLATASMNLDDYPDAKTYFAEAIEIGMEWHLVPFVLKALLGISELLIRQQYWEQALELLTPVTVHPAASYQARQRANLLLAQVRAQLSPETVALGLELPKTIRLDTVVNKLLVEQLPKIPASPMLDRRTPDLLSRRELEILRLIAGGLTNREIAERLFLAASTVKWYTLEIYSKLHVANRTQAVARARALNLLA